MGGQKYRKIDKRILQFFSALADETRLRILVTLTDKPKTVGQIYNSVGKNTMTLSNISHQLKSMSDLGIIEYEKSGREKIYSLSGTFCWCILNNAFEHFHDETKCPSCSKIRKKRVKKKE